MATYTYRLPWPPSMNTYWRRGPNVTYLTKKAREFRKEVADSLGLRSMYFPLDAELAVNLELTLPDKRARDIDNHIKAVLDALQHAGVFYNDGQVSELRVKRLHIEPPGACDVTITELLTPGGEG